jgi:GNAT superfamily N-acetyltransferase
MCRMDSAGVRIDVIGPGDAGELLTVRRAAFVSEAQQYDDPNIPPLVQTLDELRADLDRADVVTLGAWLGHRLVGSIRVEVDGTRATLGRLAVAPDLQGKGIGTRLLLAVPPHLPPETSEVRVFTAHDSVHNITGGPQGYEDEHDEALGSLTYAYLRRILGPGAGPTKDEQAAEA